MKSITDEDGFIQITLPPSAYEVESLNNEIKRINIDEEHFNEVDYPFQIKPNFSTLGSVIETSPQGPIISFMFDDSIRDHLGFNGRTLYEEYSLSPNRVDFFPIDDKFIHTNIAQGMIFRGKRSRLIQNFTLDVNPGYNYIENLRGGVQWYMMEPKDVLSSFCFKLENENENGQLVSINSQSITFRLSIKEI